MSLSNHERRRDTLFAAVAYAALTILFTWPLARGLTRDIAGDFGDPLLNAWILAWDATHLGRGWWNANIFFPHPLALAYSEHLLPQALTILPIQFVSGNPILSYNVLFLSTFALSGLGMFLFAREITGSRTAAFVAGVAYAFAPYRVTSIPHLQVLSSQWLPFALYGFRRYFDFFRSWGPALAGPTTAGPQPTPVGPPKGGPHVWLAAGSAAWILQNLSCGYYLLFFSPVVVAYLAWEMTTRSLVDTVACCRGRGSGLRGGLRRERRCSCCPTSNCVSLGFNPRSLDETTRFSADVYAYLTADPNLRLWGSVLQAWPKAEGALFPGFTIAALAARRDRHRGKGSDPVS